MMNLKVEDALSYLDQVKARFAEQGQVYADFLEVMRQFKAQTIGTPAVIQRVRELFQGHPDLIVGFNTFIPHGYRMDARPGTGIAAPISRPVIASMALDNICPFKTASVPGRMDNGGDWSNNASNNQHEHSLRTIGHIASSPPQVSIAALTNNTVTEHQSDATDCNAVTHQHPLLSNVHENYQASLLRNYNPVCGVASNPTTPHVYHQQQHAVSYVRKVKNRFQSFPGVYERFLNILHWYEEERNYDPQRRKQAELQVYQEVAKLFDGEEDLLQEFSQFLPESTGVTGTVMERRLSCTQSSLDSALSDLPPNNPSTTATDIVPSRHDITGSFPSSLPHTVLHDMKKLKRNPPLGTSSSITTTADTTMPYKKSRFPTKDISLSDVNYLTTGPDSALLHKTASPLHEPTFGSSINMHGQSIPVDGRDPKERALLERDRYNDLSGGGVLTSDTAMIETKVVSSVSASHTCAASLLGLPITSPSDVLIKRLDLDFDKLRTCGTSYRALPDNFPQSKCSGRQKCPISKEVLNDSYIGFSSLTSEDSQFVSSKKNQYEEHMYRVEDERYEVDMVMELNAAAQQNLINVKRTMDAMSKEELNRFSLNEYLGGTSKILMRKAIHRVYGDKAVDVIYGLQSCPNTVVPLVIDRMRQKDAEWRDAIRAYQRSWADQDARNYLRSLDHQGAAFRQRDNPFTRPKTLLNQIESISRQEKPYSSHLGFPYHTSSRGSIDLVGGMISAALTQPHLLARADMTSPGSLGNALANVNEGSNEDLTPHLSLVYPPPHVRSTLLEDAASLIIHHVKRQSANKEDKRTMKYLIRTVVQDIFMANRFPMSDDEDDDDYDYNDQDEDDDGVDEETAHKDDLCAIDRKSEVTGTEGRSERSVGMNIDIKTESNELPVTTSAPSSLEKCHSIPLPPYVSELSSISRDALDPAYHPHTCANGIDLEPTSTCPVVTSSNWNTCFSCRRNSFATDDACFGNIGYVSGAFAKEEHYSLFYGNNDWYSFIRLHHLLVCRLHLLRSRCYLTGTTQEESIAVLNQNESTLTQAAEVLRLRRIGGTDPSQHYTRALSLVKDLLDGGEDMTTYEDRMRDMFGIYAYPWFTLERLVINIVRQLQVVASGDELNRRLLNLYRTWYGGSNHSVQTSSSYVTSHPNKGDSPISTILPQCSGVRGPLRTRVCRIQNESAYRTQALSACSEFACQGLNFSTPFGSTVHNCCPVPGLGASGLVVSNSNVSSPSVPNCFALVMMTEASAMLIRLVEPATCRATSYDASDSGQHLCVVEPSLPRSTSRSPTTLDQAEEFSELFRTDRQSFSSVNCWFDYLTAHLLWSTGEVSENICNRIKQVFLFRNVRRCVDRLKRSAYHRRQHELVTTGDTQPEELVARVLHKTGPELGQNSSDRLHFDTGPEQEDDGTSEQATTGISIKSPTSSDRNTDFEHDVLEFLQHAFRRDLTRQEVFRGTFSSDYMQSTGRLVRKPASKFHWSAGSYGIFLRQKRREKTSCSTETLSNYKWREFHASWLAKHAHSDTIMQVANQQIGEDDSSTETVEQPDLQGELVESIITDDVDGNERTISGTVSSLHETATLSGVQSAISPSPLDDVVESIGQLPLSMGITERSGCESPIAYDKKETIDSNCLESPASSLSSLCTQEDEESKLFAHSDEPAAAPSP